MTHSVVDLEESDCLPHAVAVWRDYDGSGEQPLGSRFCRVSTEHGSGPITTGYANELLWLGVKRWRFGWPPRSER